MTAVKSSEAASEEMGLEATVKDGLQKIDVTLLQPQLCIEIMSGHLQKMP